MESRSRQKGKALDFAVGTAARHGRRAEGVDVGLDDDVGQEMTEF